MGAWVLGDGAGKSVRYDESARERLEQAIERALAALDEGAQGRKLPATSAL